MAMSVFSDMKSAMKYYMTTLAPTIHGPQALESYFQAICSLKGDTKTCIRCSHLFQTCFIFLKKSAMVIKVKEKYLVS